MALLTAAVLTPTDALGQSVVSNPEVPDHLSQTNQCGKRAERWVGAALRSFGAVDLRRRLAMRRPTVWRWEAHRIVSVRSLVLPSGWVAAKAMDWAQNRDLMQEARGRWSFS